MSIQLNPHYRAQPPMRSRFVRARHVRSMMLGALVSFTMLFAIGCGDDGSGSSDTSAVSTAPIDLEPGQTTALMAWEPSEGQVVGYLVFQSHDDGAFDFLATVATPQITISGSPGDSIRILVVALGVTSSESAASPASPPVRFHAAIDSTSAVSAAVAEASSVTTAPQTTQTQTTDAETSIADGSSAETDSTDADSETDTASTDTPSTTELTDATSEAESADADVVMIDPALREQLLGSNARFPFSGLSAEASLWIQSFVDSLVGAGVSLAGSGELGGDALRELVFIDSSGQLFVSDGSQVATSEDLPSSFVEAIRLGPTERFAGLADFDGDGVGDWLVEDTATGDAWILRDGSDDILFEHIATLNTDLVLVGHGDFDGDGLTELLWQNADGAYQIGLATDELATIEWMAPDDEASAAPHSSDQLLTVADLDGDGRDDLVFRSPDGLLDFALSRSDSTIAEFEWTPGPATSTDDLTLIATLDLDRDGIAEIAWLADGALEVWDLRDAF